MRRLLLSIILICVLTVPASAHPGGTDSSGGHYNRDTGDYHYHHGYSAHDHEDLDGDGDLDCPYNFKDKTGQDSGESSGNSSQYPPAYTRPVPPPTVPVPAVPAVTEPTRTQGTKMNWLEVFFTAMIPFWLMLGFVAAKDLLPYLFVRWWAAIKPRLSRLPEWYKVTVFILIVVIAIGLLVLASI